MADQYWNYIVTFVGLIGFYLGGQKIWWSWYVNIANQALWLLFGIFTQQWGFVVGTFFYTPVFAYNAWKWTKEHKEEQKYQALRAQGKMDALSIGFKLDANSFGKHIHMTESAMVSLKEKFEYGPKKWRWLPLWFRKRFFTPLYMKNRPGGEVIGKIKHMEMRDNGLFVTSEIDQSTAEGVKAWAAIRGPVDEVSVDHCGWCGHEITNRAETRGKYCVYCPHIIEQEKQNAGDAEIQSDEGPGSGGKREQPARRPADC